MLIIIIIYRGWLNTIERLIDGTMYCKILNTNHFPSPKTLKVGHGWVFQYDIDLNHIAKPTKEWLKKKHIQVME